jgi:hypothetical protein
MKYVTTMLCVASIFASGCGDGNPTGSTSTPVTTVIGENSTQLETNSFLILSYTGQVRGDVETIVDWTFDDSLLYMYMTAGDCTGEQFALDVCPDDPACACTFLARSESRTPKPRHLQVQNHQGFLGLIVWNVGTRNESISWQTLLTTNSTLRTSPLKAIQADTIVEGSSRKTLHGER